MHSVLIYRGTLNPADAIQTVAMSRLLGGKLRGVYRDAVHKTIPKDGTFVVNGWIGDTIPEHHFNTLFAGCSTGLNSWLSLLAAVIHRHCTHSVTKKFIRPYVAAPR